MPELAVTGVWLWGSPRHISSIEIAQVHGSSPWRRRARRRSPAGRPRRASMSTVESSRTLATSADASLVGALASDPFTGIVIPFVALVGDSPERCLDIVPSPLVIESAANQLGDESRSSLGDSPSLGAGRTMEPPSLGLLTKSVMAPAIRGLGRRCARARHTAESSHAAPRCAPCLAPRGGAPPRSAR